MLTHGRSLVMAVIMAAVLSSVATPAHADDIGFRDVVGTISDTYGTFQAAEFLISLFTLGGSDEVANAVTELETFMRNYRDQALVNSVQADLRQFIYISNNYTSGLANDLEANFVTQTINDYSQLQGDVQSGTVDDAYILMPALNLLTATMTGAWKAFGVLNPANATSDATINSYLDQTFNTDYAQIGGLLVTYDTFCASQSNTCLYSYTQGGKPMWKKYGVPFATDPTGSENADASNPYVYCDLTLPCNVDQSALSCCYTLFTPPDDPNYAKEAAGGFLQGALNQFFGDSSVIATQAGMWSLIRLGHSALTDYMSDWIFWWFPLGAGHVII